MGKGHRLDLRRLDANRRVGVTENVASPLNLSAANSVAQQATRPPTTHLPLPTMGGWIFWIVVGAVAGFLAEQIMKADMGLLMNLVLGIVGALVGGIIVDFLPFVDSDGGLIWSILVATLGAVIVLWVANKVKASSAAR